MYLTAPFKVLSFNIQAGATTNAYREYLTGSWRHVLPHPEKARNLAALGKLIEGYDFVGLQEADVGSLRSGFVNQGRHLAQLGGFSYLSEQHNRRIGMMASSGNLLLSRAAPAEVLSHALPGRVRGRGALHVRFGADETALHVVTVHLALSAEAQRMQLDFLRELTSTCQRVVLMGDFNCSPDAPHMRKFLERTGLRCANPDAPTFPSWAPTRVIDHVLVSAPIEVLGAQPLPLLGSDHLPVAAELKMSPR